MEGTIKIEALPGIGVSVAMDVKKVTRFDVLGVFDALARGFRLDEEERKTIGLVFAAGGLEAAGKAKSLELKVDDEALEILKLLKEKKNETDSD